MRSREWDSIGISDINPCFIVSNIAVAVVMFGVIVNMIIRVVAVATSVIVISDVDTDAHWASVIMLVVVVGHVVGVGVF